MNWLRRFFLFFEHFCHQMDATWAKEREDWDMYVDSQRRADECERQILRMRMMK